MDNKDYVKRTDENGTATISLDLAAGTHYIYTEYNNVIGKNKIEITKATSKITAKKATFKSKTKTKKYAITLKNRFGDLRHFKSLSITELTNLIVGIEIIVIPISKRIIICLSITQIIFHELYLTKNLCWI